MSFAVALSPSNPSPKVISAAANHQYSNGGAIPQFGAICGPRPENGVASDPRRPSSKWASTKLRRLGKRAAARLCFRCAGNRREAPQLPASWPVRLETKGYSVFRDCAPADRVSHRAFAASVGSISNPLSRELRTMRCCEPSMRTRGSAGLSAGVTPKGSIWRRRSYGRKCRWL